MPIRVICRINIDAEPCLTPRSTLIVEPFAQGNRYGLQSAQSSVILRLYLIRASDHFPSRSRLNRATIAHVPPSPGVANSGVAVPSGVECSSFSWMSEETPFIFALTKISCVRCDVALINFAQKSQLILG